MVMRRRSMLALAAVAGTSLVAPPPFLAQSDAGAATPTAGTAPETGYDPVNGLDMYYEIHGEGDPLVLIHSVFGAIDLWGSVLASLAESHQVIAVELQGHGHTADIDCGCGFEAFACDVAVLTQEENDGPRTHRPLSRHAAPPFV